MSTLSVGVSQYNKRSDYTDIVRSAASAKIVHNIGGDEDIAKIVEQHHGRVD